MKLWPCQGSYFLLFSLFLVFSVLEQAIRTSYTNKICFVLLYLIVYGVFSTNRAYRPLLLRTWSIHVCNHCCLFGVKWSVNYCVIIISCVLSTNDNGKYKGKNLLSSKMQQTVLYLFKYFWFFFSTNFWTSIFVFYVTNSGHQWRAQTMYSEKTVKFVQTFRLTKNDLLKVFFRNKNTNPFILFRYHQRPVVCMYTHPMYNLECI